MPKTIKSADKKPDDFKTDIDIKEQLTLQASALKKISERLAKTVAILVLILCSFSAMAQTTYLYVDVNASGNDDGSSWTDAYVDLQDALDAHMSSNVDEILIAEGTYYPTESPDGTSTNVKNKAFHLANVDVVIQGGFDASVGTQTGENTILSGDIGTANTQTDNCYHIFITKGLRTDSKFENLVFTQAYVTSTNYSSYSYSSKTIYANEGGAVVNHSSSLTLLNCVFYENIAGNAGIMFNVSSSLNIKNCLFYDNSTSNNGGVMLNYSSSINLTNSTFVGNTAKRGAVLYNHGSSRPICINNIFYANEATTSGDVIANGSSSEYLNSSSTNNASDADLGLFPTNASQVLVDLSSTNSSVLFENFANPKGADGVWMTADDGLNLKSNNVLVSVGDASSAPSNDILGQTRLNTPSIGCYEYLTQISNGDLLTNTLRELTITSTENVGNALQNATDEVKISYNGAFTETTNDIPSSTNVSSRYNRLWHLTYTDANANGGLLDLSFNLGSIPNSDYSYYLLERTGTSGNFSIVNILNYKIAGTKVVFTLDLDELTSGNYYTLGRSDEGAGYCLDLDGTNDWVEIDAVADDIAGSDFTIEGWFQSETNGTVLCAINTAGKGNRLILHKNNIWCTGTYNISYANPVTDNKWHHYAEVVESGVGVKVYIDGELAANLSYSGLVIASSDLISLGQEWDANPSQFNDGGVDEVRIWDVLRTQEQIQENMYRTLASNENNLVAYYNFDQASGTNLPDVSQNGNNGTLNNFALTGASSNWVESTAAVTSEALSNNLIGPGNCLDFDGSDDKVDITGLTYNPTSSSGITIEAWFYVSGTNNNMTFIGQKDGSGSGKSLLNIKSQYLGSNIGGSNVLSTVLVTTNKWHHGAVINDGSTTKLYYDGILVNSYAESAISANGAYIIGMTKNSGQKFTGLIDEVRIWNSVRTGQQIQDDMYGSLIGNETNLVAYYDFNHSSGTTLTDKTSNSNDGTLTNFSGTYWVSAAAREPFKSVRNGNLSVGSTWKGGVAPTLSTHNLAIYHDIVNITDVAYGSLILHSSAAFGLSEKIQFKGNVIINGTTSGTKAMQLNGSAKQFIAGVGQLQGLTINNSTHVGLKSTITMSNSLTLTSGNLELNNYDLTHLGSLTGGSTSSYIKTNGTGRYKMPVSTDPKVAPIGRDDYSPITLDEGSGYTYSIGLAENVYSNPVSKTTQQTTEAVSQTWNIQSSATITGLSVQLGWIASNQMTSFDSDYASMANWQGGTSSSWNKLGVSAITTASGVNYKANTGINLGTDLYYFGVGSGSSPLGETIYKIENGGATTTTYSELSLTSSTSAGFALEDIGDKVVLANVEGSFSETTNDLPSSANVFFRQGKSWQIDIFDVATNTGGLLDLEFNLGHAPSPDYSYYLLERSGVSGDFGVINNLNYKVSGNKVIFTIDLSDLNNGNYTLGRSKEGSGYSLAFDGVGDYVEINSVADDIAGGDATIEGWFISTANSDVLFAINTSAKGNVINVHRDHVYSPGNGYVYYSSKITDSKWHHVALLFDAGTGYKILIDGVVVANNPNTTLALNSNDLISIGQEWDTNPSQYLIGKADEFRVWNDLRTEEELEKNKYRTLIGDEANLVAYYKFDQTTETYLPDVSQNNNQGNLIGFSLSGSTSNWVESTAPVVGKANALQLAGPGNCLDFDGTDDYVDISSLNTSLASSDITFEAWINSTTARTKDAIFAINTSTGGNQVLLFNDALYDGNASTYTYNFPSSLADGKWHHIALVLASGNSLKLYIDGYLEVEHSNTGNLTVINSNDKLSIGMEYDSGSKTDEFDGKIDEVRIWNDVRTQTEIQDNMYASLEGDETNLVAYYDFNATTGSSLPDLTSNSNNGSLTNFSGTYWVSAADREPFKTVRSGTKSATSTWKEGTAPNSSTDRIAVFHDLTMSSSGTYERLHINSGNTLTTNADITISGDIVVNGTATGTNKLILNNTNDKQTLGGTGTLGALEVNNSNDVSLEGNLTISGALTLTSGDIELNDNDLTLSGTTSHGSSSSYLKINGTGGVKTTVGSSPVILPIGRNPYLPVIIDDGGDAEYTVSVTDKVFTDPTNPTTELTTNIVSETWTIQSSSAVNDVIVQIGWDAAEEATFTRAASAIGYWENGVSSAWVKPTSTSAATGSGPYFQTRTMDFSTNLYYLGVGDNSSPLPVELTYFNAKWQTEGETAILTWQTALEENNSHFEIERSFDGQTWEQIGTIQGQGTTFDITEYQYVDELTANSIQPAAQIYYRLKQVDYDGVFDYSPIETLNFEPSTINSFEVWPNPVDGNILKFSKTGNFFIFNNAGKILIIAEDVMEINISNLPPSTYLIKDNLGNSLLFVRN